MYYRRPLWDIALIVLSIGGVVLSATTLVPSWHRLVRHARRVRNAVDATLVRPLADVPISKTSSESEGSL